MNFCRSLRHGCKNVGPALLEKSAIWKAAVTSMRAKTGFIFYCFFWPGFESCGILVLWPRMDPAWPILGCTSFRWWSSPMDSYESPQHWYYTHLHWSLLIHIAETNRHTHLSQQIRIPPQSNSRSSEAEIFTLIFWKSIQSASSPGSAGS